MEIQLNNKIFCGTLLDRSNLKIKLNNRFDVLFFKEWQNKAYNTQTGEFGYKKDYAKNIKFVTITEMGVLKGCFSTLSLNEDYAVIHWDYKELIK